MKDEGDVRKARDNFYNNSSQNLRLLLENRYKWMNQFISNDHNGIEVGCGTGISKEFIQAKSFQLTDKENYDYLDIKNVDALNTPFEDSSFHFVISSNMIHHLPNPTLFFKEMNRILINGGVLLIQEINASLLMRILLNLMKHEGYSYDVDVFDETCICTDKEDLWSANCAIPNLLFDDPKIFEEKISFFKIEYTSFDECLSFINSGGVIAKTAYISLPKFLIKSIQKFDKILCLFPRLFALQRQIVLKNIK
jgi:ubiquinone/menaquinone biosynthesis C-methylase UbiE